MDLNRQITRTLHDEHMATIALVERLETLLSKNRKRAPDAENADTAKLLRDVRSAVESEISVHFDFEEQALFPILEDAGAGDIGNLLTEEHDAMRPLAERLVAMAGQGLDDNAWAEFRQVGIELAERMVSHIQKEEMALLFALEEMVDEEADARLAMDYAARR